MTDTPRTVTGGMRYKSPFRYPGGKAAVADFVKAVFRQNRLLDGVYAEPYAGGASVALALLFEEHASSVYINDVDPAIYAFWHSAINDTDELCRRIRDTRVSVAEWHRQRNILQTESECSVDLGFAAFFLNRTNRSGIIASAGMIGGVNQAGNWKLDARYNAPELSERVARIGRYADRIHVSNLDAFVFLRDVASTFPRATLVYLDPPYYVKGRRRLYANYYQPGDHKAIADSLPKTRFHWLVSYDNVQDIRELYSRYRRVTYELRYTAAERQSGAEVMFFSPHLVVDPAVRALLPGSSRLMSPALPASTRGRRARA
jgi:DNA adenine methylase